MIDDKFLSKLAESFYYWSKKNPVGRIPFSVAKEGAGENRIPFAHYANSLPVYLTLVKYLLQSKKKRASILDLGCGTGRNISFVSEYLNKKGYQFLGIDYSEACIRFAKDRYRKQKVNFLHYQGKKLPFPEKMFDFIISSHVIEHIPKDDVKEFIREIHRVLKNNGIAIIGTPNRKFCQDLFHRNPRDIKKFRLIIPHEHEYYYDEIRKLFFKMKLFNKVIIIGTTNKINREIMIQGADKIKLKPGLFHKIKFELYSIFRKLPFLQDIMAKIGTEYLLYKQKSDYKKLITSTYITKGNKVKESDNFIIIAYR